MRRRWPEVLETIKGIRRATWVLASTNAQVAEVSADTVTLAFSTPQLATTFRTGGHAENVQRALHETLGIDVRVETALAAASGSREPDRPGSGAAVAGSGAGDAGTSSAGQGEGGSRAARTTSGGGPVDASSTRRAEASWDTPSATAQAPARAAAGRSVEPRAPEAGRTSSGGSTAASDGVVDGPEPDPEPVPEERETARSARRTRGQPDPGRPTRRSSAVEDGDDADPDDPDLASSGLVGAPLVAQMLGGTVIDEIPDPPA